VLHLDPDEQYGSHWSAFSLEGFLKWAEKEHERATAGAAEGTAGALPAAAAKPVLYKDIELACGDMSVMQHSREFMVDLAPKAMLGAGNLVEALVSSGAHNYLECKIVQGAALWQHTRLAAIPASRADIFKDRTLSPGDKRKLMRFLKDVLEPEDNPASPSEDSTAGLGSAISSKFDDRPLVSVLEEQGLPPNLREVILYGLVLASTDQHAAAKEGPLQPGIVSAREGKAAMAKYIASVGRYGPGTGAFLVPLYGMGEIPQAFCRVAAVGGAVYVLRCPVTEILLAGRPSGSGGPLIPPAGGGPRDGSSQARPADDSAATEPRGGEGAGEGVGGAGGAPIRPGGEEKESVAGWLMQTADGQLLGCHALAGNPETLAALLGPSLCPSGWLSRCVTITDTPLQEGESQAMVIIPPRALQNRHAIYVLQMGHSAAVTPPGRCLVYFWTQASSDSSTAREDLQPAVEALLRIPSSSGSNSTEAGPCAAEPVLPDVRPALLVVGYYKQAAGVRPPEGCLPPNVALCDLPDGGVDFQQAVGRAEELYASLFPEEGPMFSGAPAGSDGQEAAGSAAADDSDDDDIMALGAALQAAGIAASRSGEGEGGDAVAGSLAASSVEGAGAQPRHESAGDVAGTEAGDPTDGNVGPSSPTS